MDRSLRTGGLPIGEAAERMGISKTALRKRVHRGKIDADKGPDGQWLVIVPPSGGRTSSYDSPRTVGQDRDTTGIGPSVHDLYERQMALLERELEVRAAENARLWEQIQVKDQEIEAWIDEAKRKDMLIAHLQGRIVELPGGAPEPPETRENSHDEPQAAMQMYRVPEAGQHRWWQFWRR